MENIKQLLKDYILEKREFKIEENSYSYFIAEYRYKKDLFAKYFIWDICEKEIYNYFCPIFSNQDKFISFEKKLLEKTFFNSIGDERYNIYLILIVADDSDLLRNSMIQNDFRYARKIVLSPNQVADYFINTIPLQRKREETYILNLNEKKKIINSLQQSISDLKFIFHEEYSTRIYLYWKDRKKTLTNKLDRDLAQLIFSFPDADIKNMPHGYRNLKDNNTNQDINRESYKIEKIQSVLIQNFRHFKQNCRVPFAQVNLLFGENGTGKTSLLEAIEFGITGMNCKSKGKNGNNAQVEVKCRNSNAKQVSLSSQKNNIILSDYWYDVKVETIQDFNLKWLIISKKP